MSGKTLSLHPKGHKECVFRAPTHSALERDEISDEVMILGHRYTILMAEPIKILLDRPLETEVPHGTEIEFTGKKTQTFLWHPNMET